jgi:hypothetical protein
MKLYLKKLYHKGWLLELSFTDNSGCFENNIFISKKQFNALKRRDRIEIEIPRWWKDEY